MRRDAERRSVQCAALVAVALLALPLPAAAGWERPPAEPVALPGRAPLALDAQNATELAPNRSVSGTVVAGSQALFRVFANRSDTAPEALTVSLGAFSGLFNFGWVEIFDPYQVLVDERVTRYDGDVNVSQFIVGETGYYLLAVASSSTYDWSLTVNLTVGAAFPNDNDNDLANATVLAGASGYVTGNVTDWGDLYDTYRFDLADRGQTADALVLNLTAAGFADLDLYIYHLEGGVAIIDSQSISPTSTEFAGHYAGATGPYYVRVLSYAGSAFYNLTWLLFDTAADANGRPEVASLLPDGETLNNLSRWDFRDVFRIDAAANTTVNVSFHTLGWNATRRSPDLQAVLWDSNFERVTWSFLFDPNEHIDALLAEPGTYYLDVFPVDISYFIVSAMSFDYTINATVDPPPVFLPPAWDGQMVEDTPRTYDLGAVIPADPPGEGIVYTVTGTAGPITASTGPDGKSLQVVPVPDGFGNGSISLTASDRWRSVDVVLPVVVAPVNDPPRLRPGAGTVTFDEDMTGVVDPHVTAVDPEGDPFSLLSVTAAAPLVATATGGSVVLSAPPDFAGQATVVLELQDNRGATSNLTVQVVVRQVNDAPRFVGSLGPLEIVEDAPAAGATFSLQGLATDPDGDPVRYSAEGSQGLSVLVVNETMTLVPALDFTGDTTVTVTASDGSLSAARTFAVHVAPVDDAPTIAPPAGQPVAREGETFRMEVAATDVDTPPEDLRYTFWLDGDLTANATANATFSFPFGYEDAGFHVIRVSVWDGTLSASLDITVFVSPTNRPPVAEVLTAAGTVFRATDVVSLAGRGKDPDGDNLTYRWIVDGVLASQTETATLAGQAPGPHTAVLFVSDGQDTVAAELSFTVEAQAPGPGILLAGAALVAVAAVARLAVRRRM